MRRSEKYKLIQDVYHEIGDYEFLSPSEKEALRCFFLPSGTMKMTTDAVGSVMGITKWQAQGLQNRAFKKILASRKKVGNRTEISEDQNSYIHRTNDMPFAAALVALGGKMTAINRLDKKRLEFVIEGTGDVMWLMSEFWASRLMVDPKVYYYTIRDIKTRISDVYANENRSSMRV